MSSRFYGSDFQGHGPSVSEALEYSFEDCSFGGHTILPLTEYQELELGKVYFNQRVLLLVLVHAQV